MPLYLVTVATTRVLLKEIEASDETEASEIACETSWDRENGWENSREEGWAEVRDVKLVK